MFGIRKKKISQELRVIRALKKAGSKGILNYEFPRMHILSYTKIISNLRQEGYTIVTDRVYVNNKGTSVFKYILRKD